MQQIPNDIKLQELNRYKGQFIKGEQPKVIRHKKKNIVHHNGQLEVTHSSFRHNGWIPPRKGAL